MTKKPLLVSGAELVAALDRVSAIMKQELQRDPALTYHVADGGLNKIPSMAVIIKFDPETMKPKTTTICSEKLAAKAWNKANQSKVW